MGTPSRPRVRHGEGDVYQFRLDLQGFLPAIWRRVLVADRASLHELHEVIQAVLGPDEDLGYHLLVDGVLFQEPDDERSALDTTSVPLRSLGLRPGARLVHVAERPGAPWEEVVTLERVLPRVVGQRLPVCLAGAGAAPPLDHDDPAQYAALVAAWQLGAEERPWLPDDFDPDFVDLVSMNAALGRIVRS